AIKRKIPAPASKIVVKTFRRKTNQACGLSWRLALAFGSEAKAPRTTRNNSTARPTMTQVPRMRESFRISPRTAPKKRGFNSRAGLTRSRSIADTAVLNSRLQSGSGIFLPDFAAGVQHYPASGRPAPGIEPGRGLDRTA